MTPNLEETLLADLNPPQREAVTYGEGPLLVLAGAGSGKTRVLTRRIAWLVLNEGVDPRRILALTFTNKAAKEMTSRLAELLGGRGGLNWVGTFHGIALRMLRAHDELLDVGRNFTVIDADDQKRIAEKVVADLKIDPKKYKPLSLLYALQRAKDEGRLPEAPPERYKNSFQGILHAFTKHYQKRMKEARALDFGDLLLETLVLFTRHPEVADHYANRFQHVLIDEYQDTNLVQFRLAERLTANWGNITVVGDDDQSIYGWRGAEIKNILSFDERWPGAKIVKLEQNYRSSSPILKAASTVISCNPDRHEKTLWTDKTEGEPVKIHVAATEEGEATWIVDTIRGLSREKIKPSQVAILYRTHALSRPLEEALIMGSVPYVVLGGLRFYERKEIKDILAYLRLMNNPDDPISFARAINEPPRGIGDKSVSVIYQTADETGKGLWEAAKLCSSQKLITKKAAKALEDFTNMVDGWREAASGRDLRQIFEAILEDSGYKAALLRENEEKAQDRLENIEELLNAAENFSREDQEGGITAFLDRAALITDADRHAPDFNAVTLMTIHSAKGLEFPVVFIAGMEEGVFPHSLSMEEDVEVKEERRLCYVAMTRAKDRLYLTRSRTRRVYGREGAYRDPSRFLSELGGVKQKPKTLESFKFRDTPPPPPPPSSSGRYVLPEPGEASYSVGMLVRHQHYGEGKITEVFGRGPAAKVTVSFNGMIKKFIAHLANLEIGC